MQTTNTDRRAWLGCLACYNAGRLEGEWFDYSAGEFVGFDEYRETHNPTHEEWEAFDAEGFGFRPGRSSSILELLEFAELLEEYETLGIPAEVAAEALEDEFGPESYRGEYESLEAYAEELVWEGCYGTVPEALASYIDLGAIARDLHHEYFLFRSGSTGYVFERY